MPVEERGAPNIKIDVKVFFLPPVKRYQFCAKN